MNKRLNAKHAALLLALIMSLIIIGTGCSDDDDKSLNEASDAVYIDVQPQEAYELIQTNVSNDKFVILDVRTSDEYTVSHIENAVNIDYYSPSFKDSLDNLDREITYLIYCRSGSRSAGALEIMKELEFQKVYQLMGGINGWVNSELPTVK